MEQSFWAQRWSAGQIGFHQGVPNPQLVAHAEALLGPTGRGGRVLVPLCGKTQDLWWLAQRCEQVVGVEFVPQAVLDLFAEAGVAPERREEATGPVFRHGNLTVFAADFFALDRDHYAARGLGPFDAVYDRAALIALPPDLRRRYAAHLAALLPAGAATLSVTLWYPEGAHQGPPFAVDDAEIQDLFGQGFDIEVRARDQSANGPGGIEVQNTTRRLVRRD